MCNVRIPSSKASSKDHKALDGSEVKEITLAEYRNLLAHGEELKKIQSSLAALEGMVDGSSDVS